MEKKVIKKTDWVSNFTLIGTPKISEDYTFKINEHSQNSSWVYNSMSLGINCGERHGIIYCEMMGGYSEENENRIFAHGKKADGTDDFEKQIIVDWEDRFDEEILEEVGDLSFITVGLEKTDKGQTFYKKFLSAYDAIAYVKKHLTEDMVVNVRGNLKYSTYNDVTQVRKNVTSIVLSKVENASDYKATFIQSVLIDRDSASLKDIDRDKSVMPVNAKVLDYVKEINGVEVKGQYPYNKQFEFELNLENEKQCKIIYEKLFKVKKDVTQITFEGDFIEGGAVTTATLKDLPDDVREYVEMGWYTEEEVLAKYSTNGSRERRMVLKRPYMKLVGDDENKVLVVQKFEERYTEDDLVLDYLYDNMTDDDTSFNESDDNEEDLDWISKL